LYTNTTMNTKRTKYDRSDDDNSLEESEMPRGVLRSKRGWEGDELELERDRTTNVDPKIPVAVNLQQFRNEEVGKGYQAKHVIRQRTAEPSSPLQINDMSKRSNDDKKDSKKKKRKDEKVPVGPPSIAKYLNCPAFRKFRKELENMR
jgi:hypothetical protein